MSFLCALPLAAQLFGACAGAAPLAVGYVEGDYVLLSPMETARVEVVLVENGEAVEAGEELVRLERRDAELAVADAEAALAQAEAELADMKKGKRPEEIAVLEATVVAAKARLSERTITAEADGRIEDVIRKPGDIAGPQAPVVSMLPEGAVRLKLYVPEPALSALAIGTRLAVSCDDCPPGQTATVSYIAPEPEFTPPVIYSLETRQKLVHLVDATPDAGSDALTPGRIVDVRLTAEPVS